MSDDGFLIRLGWIVWGVGALVALMWPAHDELLITGSGILLAGYAVRIRALVDIRRGRLCLHDCPVCGAEA